MEKLKIAKTIVVWTIPTLIVAAFSAGFIKGAIEEFKK